MVFVTMINISRKLLTETRNVFKLLGLTSLPRVTFQVSLYIHILKSLFKNLHDQFVCLNPDFSFDYISIQLFVNIQYPLSNASKI